jgi:hypothetical protein
MPTGVKVADKVKLTENTWYHSGDQVGLFKVLQEQLLLCEEDPK